MITMGKKTESFWVIVIVTTLYSAYMVYLNLVYGPDCLDLMLEIPMLLILLFYLTMLGRTFVVSDNGITVITLHFFRRVYTWNQSPRIYICTLRDKACRYNKYFIILFRSEQQTLSRPMMHSSWYLYHMNQAAIYPYSYPTEQELLKHCPKVELVRVYNDFERYSDK